MSPALHTPEKPALGAIYRDRRDTNTRWLRVDRFTMGGLQVECTVLEVRPHADSDEGMTRPDRVTRMGVDRLLSRNFLFVSKPENTEKEALS
ncbi:hypothetical protein [Nocardia sp. NPDC050435]|uniref:hypothetical protein n=1 Tax=Nocardia sp. NPDC050435 TaxID=3155040 RepID=UPI003410A986